ncbi:MAG TPA: peptide transporter, partial [Cyclobacteriaceae bacterium]|nr:peptide transporter [Cyclobacteriaceae bacterium]
TTLPIFIGGAIKGLVDWRAERNKEPKADDDLGKGSLFATGLIAGGALAGVVVALLSVNDTVYKSLKNISAEHGLVNALSENGYFILGLLFFAAMAIMLYRIASKKSEE